MKRISKIITILAFAFSSGVIWAQPGVGERPHRPNAENRQKIESARIALITQRLDLTPDEAEKFWPVYNQFSKERQSLHQKLRETHKKTDTKAASEKELRDLLDLQLATKQKELDLEKKYSAKLLDVISTRQLAALRKAEGDFRDMIKDRIERNRGERDMRKMKGQNRHPEKNGK